MKKLQSPPFSRQAKAHTTLEAMLTAVQQQTAVLNAHSAMIQKRYLGSSLEAGTGALQALMAFLCGLNNRNSDGRIITDVAAGTLKFVLLNAAAHFSKVCSPTRSQSRLIEKLKWKLPSTSRQVDRWLLLPASRKMINFRGNSILG